MMLFVGVAVAAVRGARLENDSLPIFERNLLRVCFPLVESDDSARTVLLVVRGGGCVDFRGVMADGTGCRT